MISGSEAINKLVDVKKTHHISFNNNYCVATRFIRSSCKACIEICPQNAIYKEKNKLFVNSRCDACGICISECPNGAISYTGRDLLSEIKELKHTDVIKFVCRHFTGEEKKDGVIKLNCLGSLTLNDLLYSSIRARKVILAISRCGECSSGSGMKNFAKRIKTAKELLGLKGADRNILEVISGDNLPDGKGESVDFERRRFLFLVKDGAKSAIKIIKEEKDNARSAERVNPQRRALIDFLQGIKEEDEFLNYGIPSGYVSIDKTRCLGCPVCEHVCPGGAIIREESGDSVRISFNPSLCTGCNACAESCLEGAIKVDSKINFKDFLYDNYLPLLELKSKVCKVCGIEFYSEESSLCPRCKRNS